MNLNQRIEHFFEGTWSSAMNKGRYFIIAIAIIWFGIAIW